MEPWGHHFQGDLMQLSSLRLHMSGCKGGAGDWEQYDGPVNNWKRYEKIRFLLTELSKICYFSRHFVEPSQACW